VKFLLELASEEIPARMQAAAAEQLRTRFVDGLKAAGLTHGAVVADVTPRRLWLIAQDVAAASAAASEERKGPSASAPEAAIAGFLRSTGLARVDLEERQTPKGVVLFAHIKTQGRGAAAILAELVPAIVRDFTWPKSMRWGAASATVGAPRWVRPLTGIVALLGDDVVACEAFGICSGRVTRGHRIHAPQPILVERAETYEAQLRSAKVIAASAERRALIEAGAAQAAAAKALTVIADAGLVAENAGLTEWPVPMLGMFDPGFLDVPREVIQLTMRTNQKYFACADSAGALAPVFVCVANLDASDGGAAIVAGNERVLSARLADAKFFWDQDVAAVKAGGLGVFAPKLATIVFHEKLGTVADKVERVAALAEWLVTSGAVAGDAKLARRAAELCKADLVSATVGEFPEVQGIAGAYLAGVAGEDGDIVAAAKEFYGIGATNPLSVAVSLADKLDTVISFFAIDEKPTGSRDPFALRRAGLGAIYLILSQHIPLDLNDIAPRDVIDFLVDRWKFQTRSAGGRPDLIDAVVAASSDGNLVRLGSRMRALELFVGTDDGLNLRAGVKRAANILRIEEGKDGAVFEGVTDLALFGEDAERALSAALNGAVPSIAAAVAAEDFAGAMTALAGLRPAVDAFFDTVIVNAPEPAVRANRLNLLARLRAAAMSVADFSKIEG
jgi:glycyl-tRNA synthetase beta chain